MRKKMVPVVLALLILSTASTGFANPCTDAICSLAGHASSSLGTGGVVGLLAGIAVGFAAWFYRRHSRV